VLADASQHAAQVGFWIETVQPRRSYQTIEDGGTASSGIRTGEEVVSATDRDSPDILPMSVRNLRFTIVGTRSLGGKFAIEIANSEAVGVSST